MGGGAMIVAGIGCRASCPEADILALVAEAAARAGVRVTRLAAPAFKRREAGLRDAARTLGLPTTFVDADALAAAQPLCPTRSQRALAAVGAASVAEGCALAAAGPGGRLLLARIAGPRATCAIAEGA